MQIVAKPSWTLGARRSMLAGALAIAGALAPAFAPAQSTGAPRVALIIGNAAYPTEPLDNPGNDARAVGDALKSLGFTVIEARDASKAQMELAIAQAHDALKGRNGVGMFYYAGHGLQLDWHNYLVPIDAKLSTARDVATQTVNVQQVLDAFKVAGTVMNIIVLDACRKNPFGATGRGAGLAPMDAQAGTFLAYATAPGNFAEDGDSDSGHSLFTQHLVQELMRPNTRIEDVFKRVRIHVRQRTQGRQIPWDSTSLEDEFYFDKGLQAAVPVDSASKDQAFGREKADWDRISTSNNVDDFYAFLKKYTSGSISELALARVAQLQAPKIRVQPGPDGTIQHDWASRFRDGDRYDFVFTDGLTGLVRRRASTRIRITGGDEIEVVGGGPGIGRGNGNGMGPSRSTRSGFQIQDSRGSYDPPWPLLPGGVLRVGEKWSARSIWTAPDGNKMWIDVEGRVVAREAITVPLGAIDAYKVEIATMLENGVRGKSTLWFDPVWGPPVKVVSEWRNRRGTPDITIREMTSRVRAQ